jgi:serine phosphatase RsbU (regulator of sigma subunit)
MQAAAMIDPTPATMLDVADRTLQLHDPGGYATALAMVYDPAAESATFASAGHLGPLLRAPDGSVSETRSFGTLLGLGMDEPRETVTIDLSAGTVVALYTDGIVELTRDLLAGQRRLSAALADPALIADPHPAQALVERVLGGFHATDDIAVLLLEVKASVPAPAAGGGVCLPDGSGAVFAPP